MSHHQLRKEKNCLNCGSIVEQRFCSNCGQENIEPRQTFGQLLAHFFEDLTHYEGKFWPSIRYLFFKPAFLTKEFLSGKRSKYLPPVRLYIFASFITFLLPTLIPDPPGKESEEDSFVSVNEADSSDAERRSRDSIVKSIQERVRGKDVMKARGEIGYTNEDGIVLPTEFRSMKELDSAREARAGTDEAIGFFEYRYHKKAIQLQKKKYPPKEQLELFLEALKHNVPKALFLYMPLFALILRLFHKRKNWIYFDHGIFTLHYFSFMLLAFLMMLLINTLGSWIVYLVPGLGIIDYIVAIIAIAIVYWFPYYLYRAHRKMYGETRFISFLKTTMILMLNSLLFIVVLVALIVITMFTMH